ncbi:hypothetical protein WMY93_032432 [Mugilogobius chulae]|uniref:Uncharacterized protein n=1 Tax=Mugilogobius chulae TaxID=88201 RepID=A0AAW0MN73_9GOBI
MHLVCVCVCSDSVHYVSHHAPGLCVQSLCTTSPIMHLVCVCVQSLCTTSPIMHQSLFTTSPIMHLALELSLTQTTDFRLRRMEPPLLFRKLSHPDLSPTVNRLNLDLDLGLGLDLDRTLLLQSCCCSEDTRWDSLPPHCQRCVYHHTDSQTKLSQNENSLETFQNSNITQRITLEHRVVVYAVKKGLFQVYDYGLLLHPGAPHSRSSAPKHFSNRAELREKPEEQKELSLTRRGSL